jgi:hypothetical protein
MTKNVRRLAATVSLIAILSTAPAIAAPSRDSGGARERTSIVTVLKRIAQRLFGISATSDLSGPPPAPAPTEP